MNRTILTMAGVFSKRQSRRGVSVAFAAIALAIAIGIAVPIAMLCAAGEKPGAPASTEDGVCDQQNDPPKAPAADGKSAFRITGRVIDAESGQPIAKGRVLPASVDVDDPDRITWQSQYLQQFADGRFVYETERPWNKTRVRVEADGYRPAMTRAVAKGEKSVEIDVKLVRGSFSGIVLLPNGQPAAKAQIAVASHTHEVTVSLGKLSYSGHGTSLRKVVETDDHGRFEVPAEMDPSVLVSANESGYAEISTISETGAKNNPAKLPQDVIPQNQQDLKITLQPWGRIEGRVQANNKPIVGATYWVYQSRSDNIQVGASQDVVSDAEGRFVVERIPGGSHGVCQRYVANSNDKGGHAIAGLITRFQIPPAKTLTLHLASPGRTLIGKLALPNGFPHKLDWNKVSVHVSLQPPSWGMIRDGGTYGESWTAFLQTEEGKSYVRANIVPAVDGTIQVEGLPPAEYDLTVTVTGRARSVTTCLTATS